jgi:hypothetical protein
VDPGRGSLLIFVLAGCGRVGFEAYATVDAVIDIASDPHNCGRIGHDCRLGACDAGVCQPFSYAVGEPTPWGLALDANRIYWTNDLAPGSVRACPLAGCDASGPATLASAATAITRLAVDATNVYFTEFDAGDVASCPLTGCTGAPASIQTGEFEPMGIALGGGNVYWAVSGGTEIHFRPLAGGTLVTLATTSGPRTLVTDSTSIYWASAGGEAGSCPLALCPTPTIFATGQASPYFITVYDGDAYWSNNTSPAGSIVKCAVAGCGGSPTTITASDFPLGLAVDATGIYWVAGATTGAVYHCPLAGCGATPEVLASGQNQPFSLAIDATAIYWTDAGGSVNALAKP